MTTEIENSEDKEENKNEAVETKDLPLQAVKKERRILQWQRC